MDLLDHYLRTLRIFLPRDQRDDIVRELAEEIRAQVEEQEATLGRPLDRSEQAAIIVQYGHPLLTAARYRPQRYLVGPVLFPYYWLLLRVVLALVIAGHLIGALVLVANGAPAAELGQVLENMIGTSLKVIGWITALAALGDFCLSRSRVLEKWNPLAPSHPALIAHETARQALGHVSTAIPGARPHVRHLSAHSAGSRRDPSLAGFVGVLVLSAWWLAGLRFPHLFFGPGAASLDWGGAMDRLYPVLVVAQLTMLVEAFVRLTRPEDTRIRRWARAVWLIGGWAFIYVVATSDHQWIVWHGAAETRARATIVTHIGGRGISLIDFVNYTFSIIFMFVAAGGLWHSLKALLRRFSGGQGPTTVHA
jgi:hypothetical protein